MQPKWDWERIFKDYEKLIYSIAHKAHAFYGPVLQTTFDDIVSEAWAAVMRKANKYDPEKSKLSTWIHVTAYYGIKNYCINQIRRHEYKNVNMSAIEADWGSSNDDETRQTWSSQEASTDFNHEDTSKSWIKNLLEEISEEAQALVKIILEAPEELAEVISPTSPARSRKAIEVYMIDALDWSRKDLRTAQKEIESCLA